MDRTKEMSTVPQSDEQLRQEVSARYARTALQVLGTPTEGAASCCEPSCCSTSADSSNPIPSDLYYTQRELGEIPVAAALAALGCGNQTHCRGELRHVGGIPGSVGRRKAHGSNGAANRPI